MEKKKENLAFKQEADKKLKEWKSLVMLKDKLRVQLESLEQIYNDRLRERESINGAEF
jgi:hypothetical protein